MFVGMLLNENTTHGKLTAKSNIYAHIAMERCQGDIATDASKIDLVKIKPTRVGLPYLHTVVGPKNARLVHIHTDRFNVKDGFTITTYVVHSQPAACIFIRKHDLNLDVVVVFLSLQESDFLRLRLYPIHSHPTIIAGLQVKVSTLQSCH